VRVRSTFALATLLLAAGCAGPSRGPAPGGARVPEGAEREDLPPPEPAGDVESALAALRDRSPVAPPEEVDRLRTQLAGALEAAGRPDAARVEYLALTGSPRGEAAAAAWDAVARLARAEGDEDGALRAEMGALRVAPEEQRERREDRFLAALRRLRTPSLRGLLTPSGGSAATSLVSRELEARGFAEQTVVGLLLPLSGRFENFGRAFRLGAELALADRNARRPASRPVRLVIEDTEGDLPVAERVARRAILEGGASLLIGPLLSVPALGAGAVADAFGIPLVAPTATDPAVRSVGRHVLPLDPPARELVEPLVQVAWDVLDARRFAVLVAREPVSEERERDFRAAVERRGGEVVLSVAYDPGERDFRKLLEVLEEAVPDAVYVPGDVADLEALVPQLEFYEFAPRLLGHAGWTSARVFRPGTEVLEGTILSLPAADDPTSSFAQYLREEVERVESQEPTRFHSQGYRALGAVLFAIDRGATTPEALGESLRLRGTWIERPPEEDVHLLTVRGGALVEANDETLPDPEPPPPEEAPPPAPGSD